VNELSDWIKTKLSGKAVEVNATTRLENHPCVVTVEEMAAARHFIRTQSHQLSEDRRYALLQPKFEINPRLYRLANSCA
jgi:TNF receptor-associated protein 1